MPDLHFQLVDEPEPGDAPNLDVTCHCTNPDDQYLLEIDASSVHLTHAACGKPVGPWADDALQLAPTPVTLTWTKDTDRRSGEVADAWGDLTINPREQPAPTEVPASTAPLAAGLPLVKGNCPACKRAELFLGTGGYPTCSNADCPEPDAATTVLEQYAAEAHPPQHTWRVETLDPLPNEWAPGSHFLHRPAAVERYNTANSTAPLWKDGTPVRRRIVRETTTYTVEPEA